MGPAAADMPTQEEFQELMQLIDAYERSGQGLGAVPQELQDMLKNVRRKQGVPTEDVQTLEITPEPGFVIKTTDAAGGKVFINMCHSTQVPAPGGWTNGMMPEKVQKALEQLGQDSQQQGSAEALRFPLSCSDVLPDTDKQGQPCSTIDCIIHSDVLAAAQQNRHLKAFLIELAIEHANDKHNIHLSPKFKLPKMPYKGLEVRPQCVRVDKKPLVTDVTSQMPQQDEEASFAFRTTKVLPTATNTAAKASKGHQPISSQQHEHEQPQQQNGTAGVQDVNSSDSWLGYDVRCVGKPVDSMVVTFQLPPCSSRGNDAAAAGDVAGGAAGGVCCEVSGRQLRVTVPWLQQKLCTVQLPFAAAKADAEAVLIQDSKKLVVTLRYLPLQQWVQQLVAENPQSFASLPVSHSSYMELD